MRTIVRSRFGDIEYDPAQTVEFVEGLLGFEDLTEFVVMPNPKGGPLFWIQSVADPGVAFVLTDPTNFFPDYRVLPDARERQRLALDGDAECHALSVVSVHPDKSLTLNLQAPILFFPQARRAIQVVLEKSPYTTRHPLPG